MMFIITYSFSKSWIAPTLVSNVDTHVRTQPKQTFSNFIWKWREIVRCLFFCRDSNLRTQSNNRGFVLSRINRHCLDPTLSDFYLQIFRASYDVICLHFLRTSDSTCIMLVSRSLQSLFEYLISIFTISNRACGTENYIPLPRAKFLNTPLFIVVIMIVSIATINVNGLASKTKRQSLFSNFLSSKHDIICVQETKCPPELIDEWASEWSGLSFWNAGTKHAKGVAVFCKPNFQGKILTSESCLS